MKQRTARRLGWGVVALFGGLSTVALGLQILTGGWSQVLEDLLFVPIFLGFGIVGALVVSAQPRNAVGWILLGVTVAVALAFFSDEYARYSFDVRSRPLPRAVWAAWFSSWGWLGFIAPTLTFLPLLFPDGRLPTPRWRAFAWFTGAFEVFAVASFALSPRPLEGYGLPNPVGVPALEGVVRLIDGPGLMVILVLTVASAASLFLRYRRAERDGRQQIKWFAFAVGLVAIWFVVSSIFEVLGIYNETLDTVLSVLAFLSLPVGAGIGILRYRLFDIDIVINRALLFAILAGLVTSLYVGIVVGIGAVVGSQGNVLLSILATAIIAVGFQPLRERARRLADRLVYGKRATPYELLSEFADRLGSAYSTDDVMPRMARLVGEGTGAARARVWLRVGPELRPEASWPADGDRPEPLSGRGGELPAFPREDAAFAVRDRQELLGALTVRLRPGESLTPTQVKLLQDLAGQAGLILRNVRLTEELRANLEELRASRQRLVAAQDEERRRLERDIHDGAQQQLVALAVNLNLARTLTEKDPAKAAEILDRLKAEAQEALDDLRDLARGIYPPLLQDKGLAAALESQARKAAVPVTVDADGIGRYPQEAEAAAYFCVLEALQNVAKYAGAEAVTVHLSEVDGELVFSVADDGKGFDPDTTRPGSGLQNMRDRLEALGGRLEIRSTPGEGTIVLGRVPVRGADEAPDGLP